MGQALWKTDNSRPTNGEERMARSMRGAGKEITFTRLVNW